MRCSRTSPWRRTSPSGWRCASSRAPTSRAASRRPWRWSGSRGYGGRLPRQLSGGQQQRVALARALAIRPDVLLLDEPLSNLDAKLRQEVRVEIRELQRQLGLTTVMVTHDQEEALTMADRLVVMNEGAVRQVGTQRDLYERPADRFVAGFVGRTTFLAGTVEAPGRFRTEGGLSLACSGGMTGTACWRCDRSGCKSARRAAGRATRQPPVRYGGIGFLSGRPDRHSCAPVARGPRWLFRSPNREGGFQPAIGQAVEVGWPAAAGRVCSVGTCTRVREESCRNASRSPAACPRGRCRARAAGAQAAPARGAGRSAVVVGTWGGDYSRLLAKNIETPLLVQGLGRGQRRSQRSHRARQDDRREAAAPRHLGHAGRLSRRHVRDERAGHARAIDYSKIPNART